MYSILIGSIFNTVSWLYNLRGVQSTARTDSDNSSFYECCPLTTRKESGHLLYDYAVLCIAMQNVRRAAATTFVGK